MRYTIVTPSGVSFRAGFWVKFCLSAWFDLGERFSHNEINFKLFCPLMKTSCLFADNISETAVQLQ